MAPSSPAATEGIQYPREGGAAHSTTRTAKAIFGAALEAGSTPELEAAQQALAAEGNWRRGYPQHLRALSAAGAANAAFAVASAQAGLDEAWRQLHFVRGKQPLELAAAMATPQRRLATHEHKGRGPAKVQPWALPYRGQLLQGNALRDVIARWQEQGVVEPGHAQALLRVLDNPQWLDLSDRHLVLLGAGSEAGPLAWLAKWRANLVAVDLPNTAAWKKITTLVDQGNARLLAPIPHGKSAGKPADWQEHAGANLLTDTPDIAAWLAGIAPTLDIAALAYLDGERHVRVVLAMDAIAQTVSAAKGDTGRMFMATPTDIFVVPESIANAVMLRYAQRSTLRQTALSPVRALSAGRWLRPHITELITGDQGRRYGLVDALVVEQGPNYALAKRLQQWRALVARAQGQRVSFNVAPSTTTTSVTKNAALKAGFDGAHRFGIEVFAPETTNALMAAMWVHDLRYAGSVANPATPLAHPLEQFSAAANHGGLWRMGYLPRSALPLAAMMGFLAPGKGTKHTA